MADDVKKMPKEANLGGIMHNIAESEGLIVFSQQPGIWGCSSRIAFERVEFCWYVTVEATFGRVMVSHILKAWELVEKTYGGNFGKLKNDSDVKRDAAAFMYEALEKVLAWMTNVNAVEDKQVAAYVINALSKAGCDKDSLDAAAIALIAGAARA